MAERLLGTRHLLLGPASVFTTATVTQSSSAHGLPAARPSRDLPHGPPSPPPCTHPEPALVSSRFHGDIIGSPEPTGNTPEAMEQATETDLLIVGRRVRRSYGLRATSGGQTDQCVSLSCRESRATGSRERPRSRRPERQTDDYWQLFRSAVPQLAGWNHSFLAHFCFIFIVVIFHGFSFLLDSMSHGKEMTAPGIGPVQPTARACSAVLLCLLFLELLAESPLLS